MSRRSTEHTKQETKREGKPFLQLADDELKITHDTESYIHRVVFKSKKIESQIPIQSSIFFKLRSQFLKWNENVPFNYWKNESYTLGLSKHGKIILFVKSNLKVFPKEFLRSLRQDFNFDDYEIEAFIRLLEFVELEVSHKINDPDKKLKEAKIKYTVEGLIKRLIAFTDESKDGTIELELKGDPNTSTNLEFLLRDKFHAVLFFAELTKIVKKLTEIQQELFDTIKYISNALTFILDDLLNKRLNKTKQNEVD